MITQLSTQIIIRVNEITLFYTMHFNTVRLLRFRRSCSLLNLAFRIMDYSPLGSKNKTPMQGNQIQILQEYFLKLILTHNNNLVGVVTQ